LTSRKTKSGAFDSGCEGAGAVTGGKVKPEGGAGRGASWGSGGAVTPGCRGDNSGGGGAAGDGGSAASASGARARAAASAAASRTARRGLRTRDSKVLTNPPPRFRMTQLSRASRGLRTIFSVARETPRPGAIVAASGLIDFAITARYPARKTKRHDR
jgi:hypothetical protein